jgi:hypothetical protein
MSEIKCASCDAVLPSRELEEGWCNNCGKEIPLFVYHQNGLRGPKASVHSHSGAVPLPPPPAVLDPDESFPKWQIAVIAVVVVAIAAVIVRAFV